MEWLQLFAAINLRPNHQSSLPRGVWLNRSSGANLSANGPACQLAGRGVSNAHVDYFVTSDAHQNRKVMTGSFPWPGTCGCTWQSNLAASSPLRHPQGPTVTSKIHPVTVRLWYGNRSYLPFLHITLLSSFLRQIKFKNPITGDPILQGDAQKIFTFPLIYRN